MSKIVFENVCKVFDENLKVLNGINLNIENGESHIILGQSGCGKSVLMRCLLGILRLTSGNITVDGLSVNDESKREEYVKKFSILFQGNALFDSMTISENVEFGARQINPDKKACKEIARQKLLAVGLEERVFDLYPAEISGGMQKRAALARAISLEPEVLLFDEPISGLDPITGGIICNLLKNTVQSLGITAITITHDLKVAEFLADRVSVINKGIVEWIGLPNEMKNCGNEFAEHFYKASNVITKTA
ncbi:MAG: ATP-binding cassette domain-containing protein [Alphaproteobacteria bacterium]|nr:ATP-binding cassette domain-containing protein [Alphaproteobacteria bacterium]